MKLQFYFAIIAALSNVGLSLPTFPSMKRDSAGYVVLTAEKQVFSNFSTGLLLTKQEDSSYSPDGSDFGYFIDLEIGSNSESVTLLLDSGSADMVVFNSNATCLSQNQNQLYSNQTYTSSSSSTCSDISAFNPSDSSTFKSDGENFQISYGDASESHSGVYATDNIKVGDIEIQNQIFGLVDQSTDAYGVFGIAGKYAETDSSRYDNFPIQLKSQDYIKKVTTVIGVEDDILTTVFGAVDHCKYEGGLTLVPLYVGGENQNGVSGDTWLTMNSISFGADSADDDTLILSGSALALLDSGNPVTRIPQANIDVIAKLIGAKYDKSSGLYFTDCSAGNDSHLKFNFQGVDITIPFSTFILSVSYDSGETADYCALGLVDSQDPAIFYFNVDFYSYAYVVTDLESNEIAIAPFNLDYSCQDLEAITSAIPSATSAEKYHKTFKAGESLTAVSTTSSSKPASTSSDSASCRTCSNINISTSTKSEKVSKATSQTKSQVQKQSESKTKSQTTSQLKPTISPTASSFFTSFISSSIPDNLHSSVSHTSVLYSQSNQIIHFNDSTVPSLQVSPTVEPDHSMISNASQYVGTTIDQYGQVVTITYCPRCTGTGTSIAQEKSTVGTDEQSLRSEVTVDFSQTASSTLEPGTSVTSNSYNHVGTTTDKYGHSVTITFEPLNGSTGQSLECEVTAGSSNSVSVSVSQIQYSSLISSNGTVSEVSVSNVAVLSSSSNSSTSSLVPDVESVENSGNRKLDKHHQEQPSIIPASEVKEQKPRLMSKSTTTAGTTSTKPPSQKTNTTGKVRKPRTTRPKSGSRPCDACAVRRVRCDIATAPNGRCSNCAHHNIECTNVRVRQKSGPKKIRQKTRENILNLVTAYANPNSSSNSTPSPLLSEKQRLLGAKDSVDDHDIITSNIPFEKLLPFLQVYQTWYYGIWPVVTMSELMRQILDSTLETQLLDGKVILTQRNAPIYALCSSICAAIGRQMIYLKSSHDTISVENTAPVELYAHDAKRILHLFEIDATVQHLLTSFFLSVYHIFMPDSNKQSIMYLRESITICQLLGIHDTKKISEMESAEAHRAKKIFYLLLVTERYTCLEANIPVILEPNIPFPVLEDDEFPELLVGFTELISVFSAPEIPFFKEVSGRLAKQREDELAGNDESLSKSSSMVFLDILCNQSTEWKKNWILQLQDKLRGTNIDGSHAVTVTQKLNVILSQSWFQSLGWKIASGSYLLGDSDNALGFQFPLEIAKTFLSRTKDLPHFAYEANGPGVSLKLLDIADTLSTFIGFSEIQR
ncbi:unnamed protein product [Ambrosiozyma monospora]|uniref:Unnamed protein product n=1 Tax=Ambrosiozyma monospora TaxID=43982 RepID=A0A9W6YUE8_AMBMO|nr:unnamed protein product [Ambrosiozyma monospora]